MEISEIVSEARLHKLLNFEALVTIRNRKLKYVIYQSIKENIFGRIRLTESI